MRNKSSKLKQFGYGLVASMGLYFAIASLLPSTAAVAVIIVLLTGSFL